MNKLVAYHQQHLTNISTLTHVAIVNLQICTTYIVELYTDTLLTQLIRLNGGVDSALDYRACSHSLILRTGKLNNIRYTP